MPPERSNRSRRHARQKKKNKHKSPEVNNNLAANVTLAREFEESGKLKEAAQIYERSVKLKPTDSELREEVALVYMRIGDAEQAEKHFRDAIQISPEKGFEKYAYLSQIIGNTEESLSLALKGVELIKAEVSQLDEQLSTIKTNYSSPSNSTNKQQNQIDAINERKDELKEYEASAQCAVAEIALGIIEDSNDPSVASKMDIQVEQAIMSALAISESGSSSEIEATITLANLRLSQGKKDEARNAMNRVLVCMSDALNQLNGDSGENEQVVVEALESLPPMEVRIAIGKQLMEVELWTGAIHMLSSIIWECDFNVEVWYMLAISYWKEGDLNEARQALQSARKVLHSPEGYDGTLDEELIDKLLKKFDSEPNTSAGNDEESGMKD